MFSLALGSTILLTQAPKVSAGFATPLCMPQCVPICTITNIISLPCITACIAGCVAACMSKETVISVRVNGQSVSKYIEDIKSGDFVLTLKNEEQSWTKVLRNIETEGSFEFIQITAQSMSNASHTKKIQVTPEHGLVFLNNNSPMTIDTAEYVQIGDTLPDSTGDRFSVVDISRTKLDTKYTLETCEGTVIASDFYVTTVCNEVVAGGEHLFGPTMDEWQSNHSFLC